MSYGLQCVHRSCVALLCLLYIEGTCVLCLHVIPPSLNFYGLQCICYTFMCHVRRDLLSPLSPLSPQHGTSSCCTCRDGLQQWRMGADILKKQVQTNYKGWSSSLGLTTPQTKQTPWPLVRKRIIPADRPPLFDEISCQLLWTEGCRVVSTADPLWSLISVF
jgi:hypothetical protein